MEESKYALKMTAKKALNRITLYVFDELILEHDE